MKINVRMKRLIRFDRFTVNLHLNEHIQKSFYKVIRRFDIKLSNLRSVAGLVIQATGGMEFEDGLRPESPGGVLSDNPSVRTSSLVTLVL